jgi:hypothetical protein
MVLDSNGVARRRSTAAQSVAGSSCRLNAAYASAMTDHVCAWSTASPVEVVGVEHDLRRDPLLWVDLNDVKQLGVEVLRPLTRT